MSPEKGDRATGDEAGRDIYKDIAITAESGSATSLTGDAVVGTQIKDVAGNVIIHHHVSDKDAARNQRIRQHLLAQLQATWISGVLENSIHEVARLELGLESVDEAVERPWVMSLERPNQPTQALPPTSKILDTFRALSGAMLIMGEPGSGKTITLLELARELRKVALEDGQQPAPLVFNLSSWAQERKPLLDWLVGELFLVYGVGRKQAPEWLKTMPFHLLLDGLDEVSAEHRDVCVTAINTFREEYGPVNVVVCSRTAEYEQLTKRLQLMGAAVIQPLNETQINTYLTAAAPHLTQLITNDTALHELAQTPLTLNIIALAYREHLPDEARTDTTQQRRGRLFNDYISSKFVQRESPGEVDNKQAIHYLTFIATRMQEHAQSVYYIEKMQPTWLGKHKKKLTTIFGLYGGLSSALLGLSVCGFLGSFAGVQLEGQFRGLIYGFLYIGLFGGLLWGLFGGLLGLLQGKFGKIILTEKLSWSWKRAVIVGLLLGPFSVLISMGLSDYSISGLIIGLFVTLVIGLVGGLFGQELPTKSTPNQGIRLSGRNALIVGLFFGLFGGLLGGLITGLILGQFGGLFIGLVGGLLFGLLIGLLVMMSFGEIFGGLAFLKHFVLRWLLARYNYLPFELVPFLDDMADRIILRKVGGGYIFIHRMLLEYFASLEDETHSHS